MRGGPSALRARIAFWSALPRTETGKLVRHQLLDQLTVDTYGQ
jgi:acyl-coenzyme A synthetase/AMP-(fatty) acid ligase